MVALVCLFMITLASGRLRADPPPPPPPPKPPPGPGPGLQVGDTAKLFKGVDENLKPVDMAKLIRNRPLVLIVGSAT